MSRYTVDKGIKGYHYKKITKEIAKEEEKDKRTVNNVKDNKMAIINSSLPIITLTISGINSLIKINRMT